MTRSDLDPVPLAPVGDLRTALSEAWTDLLGVASTTPSSNFYTEGGTSLTAALLLARMYAHGATANLAELIVCRTFAEQLDLLTASRLEPVVPPASGLAPLQELRLAQVARQVKKSGVARVKPLALVVELVGDVDHGLLVEAMADLVRRHDVLSLGFVDRHGRIAPFPTGAMDGWKPERIDLSAVPRPEAHARVWKLIDEAADRGLAFDTTAVILGVVAEIGPDAAIAALAVDHLVCDATSIGILYADLAEIYAAKVDGRPPGLPDLPPSAQDVLVEAEQYHTGDAPALVEKWKNLIDGYPTPPAFDLAWPASGRDYRLTVPSQASSMRFTVPAETATKLKATYRQLGIPPLAVMLAATYLAAHLVSGAWDVCMANPRSKRYTVATHVVNDFAEPTVVRIRHQGPSCPCELPLAEVAAIAATSHATSSELRIPFDMIKPYATDAGRSTSRAMIGSILRAVADDGTTRPADVTDADLDDDVLPWLWCTYTKVGSRSRPMGGAVATELEEPMPGLISTPSLWVYINDDDEKIHVEVIASEKLYDATVTSAFGSAVNHILRAFGENPGDRLSTSGPTCRTYRCD